MLVLQTRNHGTQQALVSTQDVESLSLHRWRFKTDSEGSKQFCALIDGRTVGLAQFLLSTQVVLYRNGDSLDYRRSNILPRVQNTYSADPVTGAVLLTVICEAGTFTALVDDAESLSVRKWQARVHETGTVSFVTQSSGKEKVVLDRFILGDVLLNQQVRHRNGDLFDYRRANLTTENDFFVGSDGLTRMIAHNLEHGTITTTIDAEDIERVKPFRWSVDTTTYESTGSVYFTANIDRKTVMLHRFIMGNPKGKLVDHRNPAETSDNRKQNLRVVTQTQNTRNRRKHAPAYSKYKGVSINRAGNNLAMTIRTDAGRICQRFNLDQEIEAARAYDLLAIEHHGEFALTNFPIEDYQLQKLAV